MDSSWLSPSFYEIKTRIGSGSFSNVFRAKLKSNEKAYVAIKIMDLENISSSFEDILQEVQAMKMCDDPNILRCYCSFVDGDKLWLVTELMDKGSCQRVMAVARTLGLGDGMNEDWLAYILRESLQGLNYLHNNGQIHRDIKSGNILLDAQGSVRLADFGVSGWTVDSGQRVGKVKTFVGTPVYMAPEVMEQAGGYDFRADIWSLGITALELAKGVAPYAHYSAMEVMVMTIEEEPPSLKSYATAGAGGSGGVGWDRQRNGAPFSRNFEDFYRKCLAKNPKQRPSTEELLKHGFLKNRSCYTFVDQLLNKIPSVGASADNTANNTGASAGAGAGAGAGSVVAGAAVPSDPDIMRQRLPGEGPVTLELVENIAESRQNEINSSSSSGSDKNNVGNSNAADGTGATQVTASSSSAVVQHQQASPPKPSEPRKYVAGTTWVFDDSEDQFEFEANSNSTGASGVAGRSGMMKVRVSSCFRPRKSCGGDAFSGGGGGGGGGEKNSSNSGRKGTVGAGADIDDFLNDFESSAATMSMSVTASVSMTTEGNKAQPSSSSSSISAGTGTGRTTVVTGSVDGDERIKDSNADLPTPPPARHNTSESQAQIPPPGAGIVEDTSDTAKFMDELEDIIGN